MTKKPTIQEVDSYIRQFKILIFCIIVLFILPLIIYAFYLDSRLNSFEDSLKFRPPEESQIDETASASDTYHIASNPVKGQLVYVPAYSHVYFGKGEPQLLTITLSIRNTSISDEIFIKSIKYYDTKGKELKSYLKKPSRLPALGTTEVLITRDDSSGGSGANFLVEWYSNTGVTEPIIESVMIDTSSNQGISFVRRGSVISEIESPPEEETPEAVSPETTTQDEE